MRRRIYERRRAGRGFTLIELLVVIAIIAILAAILFPIFMKARMAGQRAVCVAHMKELGVAIKMYAGDWEQRMFPAWTPYGESSTGWITAQMPYVRNDRIFQCPADKIFGFRSNTFPGTCSYAYTGLGPGDEGPGKKRVGRCLEEGFNDPAWFTQAAWVMRDMRYFPPGPSPQPKDPFDRTAKGYAKTAHTADAVYIDPGMDYYYKGLASTVLYPDGHVRHCDGWQRAIYYNNKFLGDMQ